MRGRRRERIALRLRVRSADSSRVVRPLALASRTLLALGLLALGAWVALNRADASAPDDRDLRLERLSDALAENGFDRLEAAARAARLPKGESSWDRFHAFRAGVIWEPDWISDLVAQNAPATAMLRAALAAPAFAFAPADRAGTPAERMATLLRVQQLIALSGAQARIRLRDGESRDAIELASLGLQVGKRISGAENVDLLGIDMAIAFQTLSLLDLEHAVRTARLAPDAAHALGLVLEATRWRAEDWQRIWALEYERLVAEVDAASARASDGTGLAWPMSLMPSAYRWHRNRTAAALAGLYRDQRQKSALFCANAGLLGDGPHWIRSPGVSDLLAPNAMGRIVIEATRARNLDHFQLQRCHLETHVSLVAALIAAKAYSDTEGALPEQLADLVPRYLDALPLDRYDGSPLRYARAERAIYSIGEDFTDAGPGAAPSPHDPRAPGISLAF
jgi:hypothetical protein